MQTWIQFEFPVLWENTISVFICLAVLALGTLVYKWTHRFNLGHELHEKDNPAVSLSFAAYLLSIAWIIYHLREETIPQFLLWSVLSIVALNLGRKLNDKLILPKFANDDELARDGNVGTAAVEFGSYLATSMIIQVSLIPQADVESQLLTSLISFVVYFFISQIILASSAYLFKKLSVYSLDREIEADNVAAGVSFGSFLFALGYLVSSFMERSDSLTGALVWSVLSVVYLLGVRKLFDLAILPNKKMVDEIVQDRNWGLALVEASGFICMAWFLEGMVLV